MFSKLVVCEDGFLEMPHSSQLLYFHIGMQADDDGFANNVRSIMRTVNCNEDDLKILIAKNYVIPFQSGVFVVRHWRVNNSIQKDRYTETRYKMEKRLLCSDENKAYILYQTNDDTNVIYSDRWVRPNQLV